MDFVRQWWPPYVPMGSDELAELADEWNAQDRKRDRKEFVWLCVWCVLTGMVLGGMSAWLLLMRIW